jgi:hypothetical protein
MGEARNIGGIATIKQALKPAAQAAAASFGLAGTTIDRKDFRSAVFMVDNGVATGTPTSYSIDARIEDSADGSSWAAVATSPANSAVAITQIIADSTKQFLEVDLEPYRRYVRLAFTVAFVGGTSPKVLLGAAVMLGGIVVGPPAHA